jgi:beta-lactamase regulating signal transducer with metallopeptidase domain
MNSMAWAFDWLSGAAVMSLEISALGSAAALICREPVRRMRVVTLTLAACVAAPLVALVPGLPRWSLPEWGPVVEKAGPKPQAPAMAACEVESERAGETALAGKAIQNMITVADSESVTRREDDPSPAVAMLDGDAVDDILAKSLEPRSPALAPTATAPPPSAPAPGAHSTPIDLRALVVGLYAAGLTGLAVWWLVGWIALRRVLRAARPAPEWYRDLLREIAGPAGDRVTLLLSPRARQPFTFGWRRAVIVLPVEMCDTALTTPELRWSLAHEWAHVAHNDVCVWSLAGLVRTVYFYQPLCWWLRAQLRLCQDYLADAAAARETYPEAYAEFLTTRAAGRPLAYGLGIAGGKTDLYRRVTMLVKNRRTLESCCPWWWTAAAASSAIVVILVAATFGNNPPRAAADEKPRDVKETAKEAGPTNVAPAKPEAKTGKSTPAKIEKESGASALRKLLDGLFAREKAIKSGRFTARVEWGLAKPRTTRGAAGGPYGPGAVPGPRAMPGGAAMSMMASSASRPAIETELIVSGESWLQRPGSSGESVFINHAGRSLAYRDKANPGDNNVVNINWPVAAGAVSSNRLLVPLRGGTIWYPETVPYLREHEAAATPGGTVKIHGVEAQTIDWRIPAADAERVFVTDTVSANDLLAGGGTFRLAVSAALDYAVVRIEYIDRFGTAQSVFDFYQFKKVAEGIHFPHRIEIREGARETTIDVVSVAKVNEKIDDKEFVLSIPPGSEVHDERPHRGDTFSPGNGSHKFDVSKYPLRNFTTGAEYADGLPAAMLEEMDRDVLTPEEYRSHVAGQTDDIAKFPVSPPMRAKNAAPKNRLTYGGKNFIEWRKVLLGDLEPDTRVKALTALGSFAANGYAEEVAAAIGELLKSDGPNDAVQANVQKAACESLVRCGSAAVPVLEAQLACESTESRRNAVMALSAIVPSTEAIAAALLKVVKDRDRNLRGMACLALAKSHLDRPGVADVLAQAARDGEQYVRFSTVTGLGQSGAAVDVVVNLIREFLKDDDATVRATAAAVFAARAPATDENARIVRTAVLEGGSQARKVFVERLREYQQSREISPDLTVPILVALLESGESYQNLQGYQTIFAQMIFAMIDKLPHDNAAVQAAIPVLIKTVDLELPDKQGAVWAGFVKFAAPSAAAPDDGKKPQRRYSARPSLVLSAAESLGRFGPAAKEALPALKKTLEPGWMEHHDLQDVRMETEKQWQNRIQAIINKIEGK